MLCELASQLAPVDGSDSKQAAIAGWMRACGRTEYGQCEEWGEFEDGTAASEEEENDGGDLHGGLPAK